MSDLPSGRSGAWFIGGDPASQDAGLAAFSEHGELRTHAIRVRGQMPKRLADLRREVREWIAPLHDDGVWCVCVERPSTRHGGATLLASYGVVVEACASLLTAPILTLVPKEIDAAVNLKKIPGADRKTLLRARALTLGYTGDSQDVADAVVCAHAARVLTERSQRGVAA